MIEKFYDKLLPLTKDTNKAIKLLKVSADSEKALGLSAQPHNLPAVFVYPLAHSTAGINDRPNFIDQQVTHTVGVLVALKQKQAGDKGLGADFDTIINALKSALFGWQPNGAIGAVSYNGGSFLTSEKSTLYFETRWDITENWRS